jgi:hypothetical protein
MSYFRTSPAVLFGVLALTTSAQEPGRLPAPSSASQRVSLNRIQEIFADDFAKARTAKQQSDLAAELIGHSRSTDDPSDAFALLETARGLAIDACDFAVATRVLAELESRYRVNVGAVREETLREMATRGAGGALGPVVDGLISVAAQAASRGDFNAAENYLKTATMAARKARDKQRQDAVLAELKRLREQGKAADKIMPLVKRLDADPSDRDAATLLGKHRCFVEGDWEVGLPLLARGNDAALQRLAAAELRPTVDAVTLGDAWKTYAESVKSPDRYHATDRAITHYKAALASLTGLEKVRIEKRITDAEQELANAPGVVAAMRPPHTVFLLDATATGAVLALDGKPARPQAVSLEPVGTWKDAHVRSLAAAAMAANSAPSYASNAISGNPAIHFGGKQFLVAKGPLPAVGMLMLVAQTSTPAVNGCMLGSATAAPALDAWTRSDNALWFGLFPRKGEMKRVNTEANVFQAGAPFLLTVCWPKPLIMRVNGQQKVSRNDFPPDVLGTDQFVIGSSDRSNRYSFSGFIGELVVLDQVPAPDEIARLESLLMHKWRVRP